MKTIAFINSVLEHISSSSKKQDIKYELYDHIEEKAEALKEIGYTEDGAWQKAEQDMGDADIIGEQLSAITPKGRGGAVAFSILLLVPFLIYLRYYNYSMPTLYTFLFPSLILLLSLLCMLLGIKRKSIFALCCGYGYSAVTFQFVWSTYYYIIRCAISSSARNYFYYGAPSYNGESYFEMVRTAIQIPLALVFAIGIVVIIKTRRLCNRRSDTHFLKAASIVIVCFMVLLCGFVGGITVDTVANYNSEKQKNYNELIKLDKQLLANLDLLDSPDRESLYKKAFKVFDSPFGQDMSVVGFFSDDDAEYLVNENESVHISEGFVRVGRNIKNIYSFIVDYDELFCTVPGESIDPDSIRTMSDMPLPALIYTESDMNGQYVVFSYDAKQKGNHFNSNRVEYKFVRQPGCDEYKLDYISNLEYEPIDDLTDKQKRLLNDYLMEESNFEGSDYPLYPYFEIVNVGYNKKFDLYSIDFYFKTYTVSDGKYSIESDYVDRRNYQMRFGKNKAELMCYYNVEPEGIREFYETYFTDSYSARNPVAQEDLKKHHAKYFSTGA